MTFQADLFQGRTALVSGGTQGIGAAVAAELARLGATVTAAGLAPAAGTAPPTGAPAGRARRHRRRRRSRRWSAGSAGSTSWSTAPG